LFTNSIGQFGGESLYPTNRIGLHILQNGFNNSDFAATLSSENWPETLRSIRVKNSAVLRVRWLYHFVRGEFPGY
jgi:hypothetical protein